MFLPPLDLLHTVYGSILYTYRGCPDPDGSAHAKQRAIYGEDMPDDGLKDLQWNWDTFAQQDAYWAILTDPEKAGRRWDPEEFFATGDKEIAAVLKHLTGIGLSPGHGTALD